MPQADDTQKPQRAQLKHLLLDINFKDKPKILDLEELYTPLARLLVIDILSACSCATDAMISTGVCVALGRRIGLVPERTKEIVKYCTDNNILIVIDGKITNQRVINDQESFHHKRVTNKERQQKYRERESVGNALPRDGVTRLPVNDIVYDIDPDPDLPKKDSAPPGVPIPVKFLDYVYLDEIQLDHWRKALDNDVFTRCCEKLNGWIGQAKGNPAVFPGRLEIGRNASSAFQNWVVREVSNEKKTGPPNARPTNYDRNKEQILKSYQEAKAREIR